MIPKHLQSGEAVWGLLWGHKSGPQLFVGIGTTDVQLLMLVPHFKTPRVRHAGLAAEAAAVRRPKHPIDYTRGRPLGI